ncbi:hypothetical protein EC988_006318 [Linderina pennispora]|nr:hypothetical protein EC988_006318 [Linderina pennispora]
MSIVDEFKPPVPDSQESPGTTSAYFDGTDNTKAEDDEPAAPLDLTRTITIDDTPRVDRNQMDIHYRLADINRQSQSQVPPTLLSGPQYSHLTADSSTQRPRWYSSADISDRSPESEEEVASSGHSVVRVKTKHHEYYAGPDRDDEVAHEAPAVPDHKLPAVAIDKTRSQEQEETGDSQESSPVDDSDDGLVLAADKIIASRQASKQDAERPRTIMSNPEPPERVYLGIGPSGNSPPTSVHSGNTHHSTTPAAQAAHHGTALGISDYHGVDIDARSERSSLPTHTHRRRHRRMRRISDPVTGESQMCEFVGNRRNPVGKTEQGELVDYDDPADEGAEESFRDNNVEDNFIDYLRPRFGTRLRRLRDAAANSAASTSRRQH